MQPRKLSEIEISKLYSLYLKYPSVQTDTRKLQKGSLFFALKGSRFNGNAFAQKALETGAAFAIVDELDGHADERIILVEDSLKCLQLLAGTHRDRFKIPFIGITGSNGKTTTKELVSAVLSSHYKTYTTRGNLNNHIGVPLTILGIRKDAQMAVIEMGANHQHEIEAYCRYAKPNYGLITNIGKAHLEGFGGEEGVKKGKGELFAYLKHNDGTAFVNAMDPKIVDLAASLEKKIVFGTDQADTRISILKSDPFLHLGIMGDNGFEIKTHLVGKYNTPNILAAITVGRFFHVPDEKIKIAIENYIPSNDRSQLVKKGTNTFIMDAYNANPTSMKEAIENFAAMRGVDKVLLLGDMKELGESSRREHESIVRLIDSYKWRDVALTGPEFSAVKHAYHSFINSEETGRWFRNNYFDHTLVLVKGSRSMQMEKAVG